MDLAAWGVIACRASARGRQAWYLGTDMSVPVKAGRHLIVLDDGGREIYWAGLGQGYDGQGWTDDRRDALEFLSEEHAAVDMRQARRSFGNRRGADDIELTEVVR